MITGSVHCSLGCGNDSPGFCHNFVVDFNEPPRLITRIPIDELSSYFHNSYSQANMGRNFFGGAYTTNCVPNQCSALPSATPRISLCIPIFFPRVFTCVPKPEPHRTRWQLRLIRKWHWLVGLHNFRIARQGAPLCVNGTIESHFCGPNVQKENSHAYRNFRVVRSVKHDSF